MAKLTKTLLTSTVQKAARNLNKSGTIGKFTFIFFPRQNAGDMRTFTIYCTLSYSGQKCTYSTGVKCRYDQTEPGSSFMPDDRSKSSLITDLSAKLNATYTELKITNRPIDLRLIWLVSNGQTLEDPTPNLIRCYDLFMDEIRQSYEAGVFKDKAYAKIKGFDKKIREYTLDKYGLHASIDDIKPAHANTLRLWLLNERKLSASYSDYIVAHLKRILEFAVENEWITRNPLIRFRKRKPKKNIVALTEDEVDAIRNLEIFAPALETIKQAFLFQCFTGLGYKDMATVTVSDILTDEKTGVEYIIKHRSKTGNRSIIPIITETRRIIDLFADHPQRIQSGLLIPTITNQRYNNYLKQLGGLLNFKKILTSHMGRKTAASTYLTKGVSLESVSALLGHSDTKMTQAHYATTDAKRVIHDFSAITKLSKAQ